MAAFKVGDKARIIDGAELKQRHWLGCEVTILAGVGSSDSPSGRGRYQISRPATDAAACDRYFCLPHLLAPLTDPGAESFIARIKKLGSEPVNDAPKVTVREGK